MPSIKKVILRIALPVPLRRLFDYLPPQDIDFKNLTPGVRVRVPFQSRTLIGVLIELAKETTVPDGKLKTAVAIIDELPIFAPDVYQLCQWAADYYHYALGEVLAGALPVLLRKGKILDDTPLTITKQINDLPLLPTLNSAQQQAVTTISAAKDTFRVFLLDGVTGSGKTEVYLRVIDEVLQAGKQVLVLVPEISLTPQTIARFQARFTVEIALLHSNLSETVRLQVWQQARTGCVQIVIGTRSAIFTPFQQLGLIIVDEEHDASFKQQDRFRYHARDLAIMRANIKQIPIVLGSATPSLESLCNAKRGRYACLSLPERAGLARLPQYQLIDLRQTTVTDGLSSELLTNMREHLAADNQILLFLNRRGFAPVLYCTECAWIADCRRCDARMVYHRTPPRLHCHHCDARYEIPAQCAKCGATTLQPIGLGTQRLEQTLTNYFPDIPIIRVDRDNTRRRNAFNNLLDEIHGHKKAILLGTQMLAKGHHFPQVTLVGVIDADSGLLSADFRAAEHMGQLLLQVAGRAGRVEKPGTVIMQTRQPAHPLLQVLIHSGYQHFAQALLLEREQAKLPPFSYFAIFRAEAYQQESANAFLTAIRNMCISTVDTIKILGPTPAIMAKKKGLYCQHLVMQATERRVLQQWLKQMIEKIEKLSIAQPVKWTLDVDPLEVM